MYTHHTNRDTDPRHQPVQGPVTQPCGGNLESPAAAPLTATTKPVMDMTTDHRTIWTFGLEKKRPPFFKGEYCNLGDRALAPTPFHLLPSKKKTA